MQFQSDCLQSPVIRPKQLETTALGAAYLAGLAVEYWSSLSEIASMWKAEKTFEPKIRADERDRLYKVWRRAVERALGWARILREADLG